MDSLSERTILARHETDSGQIQLQSRLFPDGTAAYEIIVDGVFLMASYNRGSGGALTRYALDALQIRPRRGLRVLVGGLGMGFTLQEALVDGVAAVDVVELSKEIIEWNRDHFSELNGHALADPRVTVIQDNLLTLLTGGTCRKYDIVALDVDNGPTWLAHEENQRLYTLESLHRWAAMLAPGGVFGVWSAQREPEFFARMQHVFDQVRELPARAQDHRPEIPDDYIYLGYSAAEG